MAENRVMKKTDRGTRLKMAETEKVKIAKNPSETVEAGIQREVGKKVLWEDEGLQAIDGWNEGGWHELGILSWLVLPVFRGWHSGDVLCHNRP